MESLKESLDKSREREILKRIDQREQQYMSHALSSIEQQAKKEESSVDKKSNYIDRQLEEEEYRL